MRHAQRKKTYIAARGTQDKVGGAPEAMAKPVTGPTVTSGPPSNVNTVPSGEGASAFELRLIDLVRTVWSHRNTIAIGLGAGMVLGLLAALVMGPSYTATAILQPNLVSEAPAKGVQAPVLDAGMLLESEIELISLQPLPDAVTIALNEKLPAGRGGRSVSTLLSGALSGLTGFLGLSGNHAGDKPNPLASRSDISLDVGYRNRTYLIEVTVRASTPERAAAFANAVARQYAVSNELRQLRVREAAAQLAVAELKASYGDRHPLVVRAESELTQMSSQLSAGALAASELSNAAIAVPASADGAHMVSSYKTIAMWAVLGVISALGFLLFKERKNLLRYA